MLVATCVGLKPLSPLRTGEVGKLKPLSPLRVRNGCFWRVFRLQRCHWFQPRHVAMSCGRKSSPCAARCGCEREIVRPANEKWHKIGVLWHVGRTFSRKHRWRGCVGRVFSRIPAPRPGIRGPWCPTCGKGWGFALHEAFQGCVVGVSEPHVVQFPRLAAAKPRREAVCSPNCRPIGQRTLKIGHFEAMGLHFGGIGVCKRVG